MVVVPGAVSEPSTLVGKPASALYAAAFVRAVFVSRCTVPKFVALGATLLSQT